MNIACKGRLKTFQTACFIPILKNNLTKSKQFGSIIRAGRILESDVWPTAKAMCVPCSANKCRIRESDLQATCLYIIFLDWYDFIEWV